jgi:hypothetical protein
MENFESENLVQKSNKSTKTKLKKIRRPFNIFNGRLDVLIDLEVAKEEENCSRCGNTAKIVIINTNYIQRTIYRCTNHKFSAKKDFCKKNKLLLRNFRYLMFLFYDKSKAWCFFFDHSCSQKRLRTILKEFLRRRTIIGGPEKIVQAD